MKKVNMIFFTIICLIVSISSAKAFTCSYDNYSNSMASEKKSVSFEINDNGEVTKANNLPLAADQYDKIKAQVKSSKSCPTYAFIGNNGFVYMYFDKNQMLDDMSSFGKTQLNGAEEKSNSSSAATQKLNELSMYCSSVAGKKYDYTSCWDESKTTTKYQQCKNDASATGNYIRSTRSELRGYAQSGVLNSSDKAFTTMEKVCANAETNISAYEKALEYTSCKDYKAAMGVDIDCSTKYSDVQDNPYVDNDDGNATNVDLSSSVNCGVFGDVNDKSTIAYYLNRIFNIIKFLGPVLVLVTTIVDLVKSVAAMKQDGELQKLGGKTLKRVFYAALLFIIPSLINLIFNLVGLYGTCGIK